MSTNFSTRKHAMSVVGQTDNDTSFVTKQFLIDSGLFDNSQLDIYADNDFVQEQHVVISSGIIITSHTFDNDSGEDINIILRVELVMSDSSTIIWSETPHTLKRLTRTIIVMDEKNGIRVDTLLSQVVPPPSSTNILKLTINGTTASGTTVNYSFQVLKWNDEENPNGFIVSGQDVYCMLETVWGDAARERHVNKITEWYRLST